MMYWNAEKGTYVSAAEHFEYRFEHTWKNWIGTGDAVDEFLKDYADAYDIDALFADTFELDYETGDYYITPDEIDFEKYAL